MVSNCNVLDFGATQNNHLVFYYKLIRPGSLPSGTGKLSIMLKYNSSSIPQRITSLDILDTFWSGTIHESTIGGNVSENQVQVSGSSIYLEFETSGGIKSSSCLYPITKTPPPSFTLSPTTLSLPCGDISQRTFTVTPANIPAGANVTYNWSNDGWTLVSSTTTSRTLVPTSSAILPSNVLVTPSINGVAQTTKTCTVTRAPFTTTSQITGSGVVCPGGTATFNLSDSGSFANVTWSIPEFGVAAIQNSTNSSVTVEALTSGTFTIYAVVTNECGQTQTIPRTLISGVPTVDPFYNTISGMYNWYSVNYSPFQIGVYPIENATSYVWTITGSSSSSNCFNLPKFSNGSSTMTSSNYVTINTGGCEGNYVVTCRPTNACGQSFDIQSKGFTVGHPSDNPCNYEPIGLKMINPIKTNDEIVLNIESKHHSELPCNTSRGIKIDKEFTNVEVENIQYSINVYDLYGRKIISKKTKPGETKIYDSKLTKGKYIVNISDDLGFTKREILIVD